MFPAFVARGRDCLLALVSQGIGALGGAQLNNGSSSWAAVAGREVDVSVDLLDSVRTVDHLRGAGLLAIAT